MNKEKKFIEKICANLPKSEKQINKIWQSDSEIIEIGESKILINIDEFSSEDMLRENNPYVLGWNVAVGAISDIYASGGKPQYYAHSMTIDKKWDRKFIDLFSTGIGDVLRKTNTFFIGGDFGQADNWRYTATVIGKPMKNIITRIGSEWGDSIYITGNVGLGNIEAAFRLYSENPLINKILSLKKNFFPIRDKEAELINNYGKSCIDTSDGVFEAVNTIAELNECGFILSDPPYLPLGKKISKILSLPKELLFLGGCGEYELLFTVDKKEEAAFLNNAKNHKLIFTKIGEMTNTDTKMLLSSDKKIDLRHFSIFARNYENIKEYLGDLTDFIERPL